MDLVFFLVLFISLISAWYFFFRKVKVCKDCGNILKGTERPEGIKCEICKRSQKQWLEMPFFEWRRKRKIKEEKRGKKWP